MKWKCSYCDHTEKKMAEIIAHEHKCAKNPQNNDTRTTRE